VEVTKDDSLSWFAVIESPFLFYY